jgi:hypothetical protein
MNIMPDQSVCRKNAMAKFLKTMNLEWRLQTAKIDYMGTSRVNYLLSERVL